jgi:hypothetical protein
MRSPSCESSPSAAFAATWTRTPPRAAPSTGAVVRVLDAAVGAHRDPAIGMRGGHRAGLPAAGLEARRELESPDRHALADQRQREGIRRAWRVTVRHAFENETPRRFIELAVEVAGVAGRLAEPAREARDGAVAAG